MIALQVVEWAVAALALGWMLYLVVRKPRDLRLRSIAAVVLFGTLGWPFGIAASKGVDFVGLEPMWSRFVNHALTVTVAYCLVCFFLFSAFDPRRAAARAWWQALVLAAVLIVLIVATATIPSDVRTAAAMLPVETRPQQRGVASIGLFYVTVNCYLLYVFVTAAVLTRRYARSAERHLRRALLLAMWGSIALVLALIIFAAGDIVYWAGEVMPSHLLLLGMWAMVPGIVLFLLGISYPAAVTRLAAGRIWWHHLHAYHALRPLWAMLHTEFPEDALARLPNQLWQDRITITGIHRRFYRRLIECRDGLVRISPYVADIRANAPQSGPVVADLPAQLRQALRAHAIGVEPVGNRAIPIAVPTSGRLDADVNELVALARALVPARAATTGTEKGAISQ
ncbi:hypothetical protein OG203_11245 [Nocardia sp. NBC_01499]|uniref:MAB_1171c family putative transporter n=1 Tax=Nocardia sp. NBC_01499 TaxID=2903597 RepID=UPI003862E36B